MKKQFNGIKIELTFLNDEVNLFYSFVSSFFEQNHKAWNQKLFKKKKKKKKIKWKKEHPRVNDQTIKTLENNLLFSDHGSFYSKV